ncbi:MAG: amidohydrolase [Chloroflexi bacterium]|nr:amidohydrolase [Chloroflexota bacterium]
MIIDAHRHLWSVFQRHPAAFGAPPPARLDWEEAAGEMAAEMNGADVDRAVLLVADFAARLGDPPYPIQEENRLIVEAARRYPERVIPFYGIDPRRPGAADGFERAIREWGVRGIKLHPAVGFFPHHRACYPLYEICVAHDLPVLFHSGPASFSPLLYNRFTHPLEFDQVATDFPQLTIILGHACGDWWEDGIAIARGHPRMVLELSEWQLRLKEAPEESVHALDRMRRGVGVERMMWGTDFPGVRHLMSLKECVQVFRDLPATASRFGERFTEREVAAILGGTAARLLKLDG